METCPAFPKLNTGAIVHFAILIEIGTNAPFDLFEIMAIVPFDSFEVLANVLFAPMIEIWDTGAAF